MKYINIFKTFGALALLVSASGNAWAACHYADESNPPRHLYVPMNGYDNKNIQLTTNAHYSGRELNLFVATIGNSMPPIRAFCSSQIFYEVVEFYEMPYGTPVYDSRLRYYIFPTNVEGIKVAIGNNSPNFATSTITYPRRVSAKQLPQGATYDEFKRMGGAGWSHKNTRFSN